MLFQNFSGHSYVKYCSKALFDLISIMLYSGYAQRTKQDGGESMHGDFMYIQF